MYRWWMFRCHCSRSCRWIRFGGDCLERMEVVVSFLFGPVFVDLVGGRVWLIRVSSAEFGEILMEMGLMKLHHHLL